MKVVHTLQKLRNYSCLPTSAPRVFFEVCVTLMFSVSISISESWPSAGPAPVGKRNTASPFAAVPHPYRPPPRPPVTADSMLHALGSNSTHRSMKPNCASVRTPGLRQPARRHRRSLRHPNQHRFGQMLENRSFQRFLQPSHSKQYAAAVRHWAKNKCCGRNRGETLRYVLLQYRTNFLRGKLRIPARRSPEPAEECIAGSLIKNCSMRDGDKHHHHIA